MQYAELFKKAREHFKNNMPFVLFSLPHDGRLRGAFQKDAIMHTTTDFLEQSFVMAPFHFKGEMLQIPFQHSDFYEVDTIETTHHKETPFVLDESEHDRKSHIALVAKAIQTIENDDAQKIVVSREKKLPLNNFDISLLCKTLFSQYPDAFTYVWYHPETDIWCGATPEVLLHTKNLNFNTMALAGTQRVDDKKMIQWSPKEKREQQWVTDAIIDSLERKTSVLKVSKTKTHIAGNLAHLKTEISGVLNTTRATLKEISNALHPTPAICGTPRDAALKFITKNEGYHRSYYTGFLGPVCELQRCSKLFVNLRCLSINDTIATLYAGGGITIDSNPESEWEETHNKLQTMAKVLQPLL